MPLIFILDDDDDTLFAMEFWLKRKGYSVKSFASANLMLQHLKATKPDIVLLDIFLNGDDGRDVCRHLKCNENIGRPVFLISTYTDCTDNFSSCQADGFMQKPYNMKELPDLVRNKMMLLS